MEVERRDNVFIKTLSPHFPVIYSSSSYRPFPFIFTFLCCFLSFFFSFYIIFFIQLSYVFFSSSFISYFLFFFVFLLTSILVSFVQLILFSFHFGFGFPHPYPQKVTNKSFTLTHMNHKILLSSLFSLQGNKESWARE